MSSERLAAIRAEIALLEADLRRGSEWCPNKPWPKQQAFIDLECFDALYGGAAGGGKTDALLASALKYFDRPGYSALLLRRTYPDLALPKAIMDRSHTWLDETRAQWSEKDKRWELPGGGVLQFGYCDKESDLQRYKSAEFQFIGIDEITEWPERWCTFLMSRIRRLKGVEIPLRFRGATNPDGPGQLWVRERYSIPEGIELPEPIWTGKERVFWPARAEDNPSLDLPAYETALEQFAGGRQTVRWKQLRLGIWLPDVEGLVYAFEAAKNVVKAAPRLSNYLLGIDYGFNDETAFAVLGWRENDPTVYVVEVRKAAGLTPSDAAEIAKELETSYQPVKVVGDTGGLGKGYAEEARKRFAIPIEAAAKNNKRGYIDLLNDALRNGRLKVVAGAGDELLKEWSQLAWDAKRQKELAGFDNHCADAVLYAWRACSAYHEQPLPERPKPGTPEWNQQRIKQLEEEERALLEAAESVQRKDWWDVS